MGPAGVRLLVGVLAGLVWLLGQREEGIAGDVPAPAPTVFPRCDFDPVPASGPQGTRFLLQGICYPIHSGRQGYVFFDDTLIASPRGDTPGSYEITYIVPAGTALGPHRLEFRLSPEGGVVAGATFTVTGGFLAGFCEFDPIPAAGPPGTRVDFDGYCYATHSGRPGYIEYGDTKVAQFRGDTIALYNVSFTIPDDEIPGPHEFRFRDAPGGVIYARATFTVRERLDYCHGDCNRDGSVPAGEVDAAVRLALGEVGVDDCARADRNVDGEISIEELVSSARSAIYGCPHECTTPGDCGTFVCNDPLTTLCPACRDVGNQCVVDDDCSWRGQNHVCVAVNQDACACLPTNLCRRRCSEIDPCAAGQRCDEAGHCVGQSCGGCPARFACGEGDAVCRRQSCLFDDDCGGGVCVNGLCYDGPGICGP